MNESIRKKNHDFRSNKTLDNVYTPENGYNDFLKDYNKWNYFSMIHSVFQPFSLVVYNKSHKLTNDAIVHHCTRTNIHFPSSPNTFIIFHGRLVHSGAASSYESSDSFNIRRDIRLFSYLTKPLSEPTKRDSNEARISSRVAKEYKSPLDEGEVDRSTYKMCQNGSCLTCNVFYSNIDKNWDDLNLDRLIKNMEKKKNVATSKDKVVSIAGDLNELGWEVFTGYDVTNIKHLDMKQELEDVVINSHKKKYNWHGIQDNRKQMKIGIETDPSSPNKMSATIKVFQNIRDKYLTKVPVLGEHILMRSMSVLCNLGNHQIDEQDPHRDYKQVKLNEPLFKTNVKDRKRKSSPSKSPSSKKKTKK